jgi:peptidoglycan/LPS O-acetylase OafA/YrhL
VTKITPLTSLRFVAAAFMVVFHLGAASAFGVPVDGRFALGVSFFFVLSGFILTYVYRDFSAVSVGRFYAARGVRLWPIHLVTFAFTIAFIPPQGSWFTTTWEGFFMGVLNLSLLQSWIPIPATVFSYNAVSWCVSVELFFYLCFPLLAKSRRFAKLYLGILALVLSTIGIVTFLDGALPTDPWSVSWHSFVQQNPLGRFAEFATGVAAGRMFLATPMRIKSFTTATILEASAIYVVLLFILSSPRDPKGAFLVWYSQSGGMFCFAWLVACFACSSGWFSQVLSHRCFVLLGEISFSVFMIHQIVIRCAVAYGIPAELGQVGATAAVVLVIYAASFFLWRFFEMPVRSGLFRLLTERRHV